MNDLQLTSTHSRRLSISLLIAWGLTAICVFATIMMMQRLSTARTENNILRQQLAISELDQRSLKNEQEAARILRDYQPAPAGRADIPSETLSK